MVERIITQYIIILIYFLSFISNKKPAMSPLNASSILGDCPMSAAPLA